MIKLIAKDLCNQEIINILKENHFYDKLINLGLFSLLIIFFIIGGVVIKKKISDKSIQYITISVFTFHVLILIFDKILFKLIQKYF